MLKLSDCPYRDEITAAMKAYLPQWAPEWGHAQLYQESRWNPKALNASSGAKGIAQFMDPTWQDMIDQLGFVDTASPFEPMFAIPAFAFYMKQQRAKWTAPRPEADRRRLAQASYNSGFGNILSAQRAAHNASDSGSILAALPQVTGEKNAAETLDYVLKINRWFLELTAPQS